MVFISCVTLNHLIRGQMSWFDVLYGGFSVPLLWSCFVDRAWLKVFHVCLFLITGGLLVYLSEYSRPIGFVIMAFAEIYAYTYGLLKKAMKTKLAIFASAYFFIFSIALDQDPQSGFMWVFMCGMIHFALWVNAKDLIEKAKKADELEKKFLTESLTQSLRAGLILAGEHKKDLEHGS